MKLSTLYYLANVAFVLIVAAGALISPSSAHPLYLIVLFALCSSPLLDMRHLNDRFVLLVLFSAVFFQFYGTSDLVHLLSALPDMVAPGIMSASELVILVAGALVQIFYRVACRAAPAAPSATPKDWSEASLVWLGGLLWAVSTALTWDLKVNIVVAASNDAVTRGLGSLNPWQAAGYILATMLQPLGILIIAYAQCRHRRPYMLAMLLGVVAVQLVMGFVVDIKGVALLGGAIAIVTKLLVEGKLPKVWLVTMALFVAVTFPVLQANRTVRDQYSVNHSDVAGNILKTLERAVDLSKRKPVSQEERSLSALERMSLKASVDLIVDKTGNEVKFQNGYTLSPLLAVFIPRVIWPTKPDVATGQIMNREFKVTDFEDTYISPSHLGELYWNFGWAGVLLGMPLFGLLLGFVGVRNDLTRAVTLTRVMILVATFQLIILGAESSIAAQYSMWLRSLAAMGILHWCLARVPAPGRLGSAQEPSPASGAPQPASAAAFPNLMR